MKEKFKAQILDNKNRLVGFTVATIAAAIVPMASAQTIVGGGTGLEFGAWVDSVQKTAVGVINSAGPALFGLMALIGGVFFVWNRVRSLW